MTLTEYDEAKVMQQLKEEYLEEGKKILIMQMSKNADIKTVSSMTEISVEEIERMLKS